MRKAGYRYGERTRRGWHWGSSWRKSGWLKAQVRAAPECHSAGRRATAAQTGDEPIKIRACRHLPRIKVPRRSPRHARLCKSRRTRSSACASGSDRSSRTRSASCWAAAGELSSAAWARQATSRARSRRPWPPRARHRSSCMRPRPSTATWAWSAPKIS